MQGKDNEGSMLCEKVTICIGREGRHDKSPDNMTSTAILEALNFGQDFSGSLSFVPLCGALGNNEAVPVAHRTVLQNQLQGAVSISAIK